MDLQHLLSQAPSLPLLFLLSFLAATILPLGSEWLLAVMISQGFPVESVVITAAFGNYLGGCTTYLIGILGSDFLIGKLLRIDQKQLDKSKILYAKFGSWSLLFSWLPIIGDPLCLLAGIFKVHFLRFSLLVFLGKFMRYATLALLVTKGMGN
jgi:membrane protein YqaA with SNARE-associated domain